MCEILSLLQVHFWGINVDYSRSLFELYEAVINFYYPYVEKSYGLKTPNLVDFSIRLQKSLLLPADGRSGLEETLAGCREFHVKRSLEFVPRCYVIPGYEIGVIEEVSTNAQDLVTQLSARSHLRNRKDEEGNADVRSYRVPDCKFCEDGGKGRVEEWRREKLRGRTNTATPMCIL